MKSLQIRLAKRYRFTSPVPGQHEHILYRGIHTQTNESLFIKGQQHKKSPSDNFLSVLKEAKILQIMQGGIGIAQMHWCSHQDEYSFIVLQELDRSLQTLMTQYGGQFSLKTTLMLGQQIVSILQYFHFKDFIHNQIMPNNFILGSGEKQDKLYLVDFCAAMRYRDDKTNEHKSENKSNEPRTVNLEFSSVRYNKGEVVSRRDDMESVLYVMLFMLKRELPWSKFATNSKKSKSERARKVLKIKESIKEETLFAGYPQLLLLFKYTRSLQFEEKPRYTYYKTVMKQKIEQMGMIDDHVYDWMLVEDLSYQEHFDLNIEIVPDEAEYVKQLDKEINMIQKLLPLKQESTKPKIVVEVKSGHQRQRQCQIY